jgi:hypothetical protein
LKGVPFGLQVRNGEVGVDFSDDFDQLIDIAFKGLNIGAVNCRLERVCSRL